MHRQIHQPLEDTWHFHLSRMEDALDESIRALQNLQRLDEYHRHGHEEEQLKASLGPVGASSINLSNLSEVLNRQGGGRGASPERMARIEKLLKSLESSRKYCSETPSTLPMASITEEESAIHERAEIHYNEMSQIYRDLRAAQLELHAKYLPETHDPLFDAFSWRQLSPGERRSCPPFVIIAELDETDGDTLRKVMSLLESRKPFKIVLLRNSLRKQYPPTTDTSVPASLAVEMIPLAMRGVYFLQSCPADAEMDQRLFNAFTSPRPGLISLLAGKTDESTQELKERAELAVKSRAFPLMIYDPDMAPGFVSCFDLSGNPLDADGFSFGDYAASIPEFNEEFSIPDPDIPVSNYITLSDYLLLSRHQRMGKLPCIRRQSPDGQETTAVVSQSIVTQTTDYNHLWTTLKELTGLDNPYVKSTREDLQQTYETRNKKAIEALREDMEQTRIQAERVAVASAVQGIVAHFTGVSRTDIDLQELIRDPSAT